MGRRRALAVPFVITVAASIGCTGFEGAGRQELPPNPPLPQVDAGASAGEGVGSDGARGTRAPPKPEIVRNADGTCTEFVDVVCEEGETCNPPPPREVPCPPELAGGAGDGPLPQAPLNARVQVNEVGDCSMVFVERCGPDGECEPPPARNVLCPPEVLAKLPEAPNSDGRVQNNPSGACVFLPDPPACEEGATCNPPVPMAVKCPPEERAELPEAPSSGGHLERKPDGTCTFYHNTPSCPPGATCNPPPPMQVKCPPEEKPDPKDALPDAPSSGGSVTVNEDGSCTFYFDSNCPEGVKCNPPPPMQVKCPAPEKPKLKGTIRKLDDGSCKLYRATSCPEGARCNPPPPRKIECPPGMVAGEVRKSG